MDNLHITIEIKAPAIVDAIELLALAISNQSKLLKAPEKAVAEAPKTIAAPDAEVAPTDSEPPKISEVEIRSKFVALSKKGKKDELKALLTKMGVSKVSDLQPDQYQDAMSKLEAM